MGPKESNSEQKDRSFVVSLERGLRVIAAFGEESPLLTVSETACRAEISRAAARRFLRTLKQIGYVASDDDQRYYLKPSVMALGYSYLSSLRIDQIALPALTSMMEKIGTSCSMAVLSDAEIVYIARVDKQQPLRVSIRVGERLPAFSTALGRVLLSELTDAEVAAILKKTHFRKFTSDTIIDPARLLAIIKEVRRKGWASVVNQQIQGWASVAIPIRNAQRQIVAAINSSAQNQRSQSSLVDLSLPVLRSAAAEIEWALKSANTRLALP